MRMAFSFAGSGFKSLIQVGYAQAYLNLLNKNLIKKYDYLTGTSAGSLISAFVHSGQISQLKDIFLNISSGDVFYPNPLKAFGHEASLADNTPLINTLKKKLDCEAIVANKTPCWVNATSTQTWTTTKFNLPDEQPKNIPDILADSCCVPLAFPCRHNLVDGGVIFDFPLLPLLAYDVDVIVLFVASTMDCTPIRDGVDMAERVISALLYNQLVLELQALHIANPDKKVILIQPDKNVSIPLLDISSVSKKDRQAWIDYGEQLATPILQSIGVSSSTVEQHTTSPLAAVEKLRRNRSGNFS